MPVTGGDNREVVRRISSPVFVGRAEQLEALDAALAAARAGDGVHRPGQRRGRHRQDAPAGGVRGACERRRRARADRQLHRARRRRAAARPARRDPAPARARARARRLAAVLGPARAVLDPAAPDNQASRLELVLAMLGRLGELAPAVIAIEDLHWADRSTRDLLAYLIRSLRREPIVLVATYRSDELHRRHPLRAFLTAHAGGVERIELARFDEDELRAARDRDPRRGARARAGRAAAGALRGQRVPGRGAARRRRAPSCPTRCARRCWHASSGCRTRRQAALRVAACAGAERAHRLLSATAGLPELELEDALREAVTHHVLVRSGGDAYAFRHALLREAVYADVLPGERARLHAAIARALERRAGPGERGRRGRGRGARPPLEGRARARRGARGVGRRRSRRRADRRVPGGPAPLRVRARRLGPRRGRRGPRRDGSDRPDAPRRRRGAPRPPIASARSRWRVTRRPGSTPGATRSAPGWCRSDWAATCGSWAARTRRRRPTAKRSPRCRPIRPAPNARGSSRPRASC